MERDKLLRTAKRYEKRNFKSAHFRRAYITYCNKIELVKPEQFKKIVSGRESNVLDMENFKNKRNENDKVNSFIQSFVNNSVRFAFQETAKTRDKCSR